MEWKADRLSKKVPGPGDYNPQPIKTKKKVFLPKSDRKLLNLEKVDAIGPLSYDVSITNMCAS